MKKVLSICAALVVCAAMWAQDPVKLYLRLGDQGWEQSDAKFAVYYWNQDGDGWSNFMTPVEGKEGLFETSIPEGFPNVIFVRLANKGAEQVPDWGDKWTQTDDLDLTKRGEFDVFTLISGGIDGPCKGIWENIDPEDLVYQVFVPEETDKVFIAGDWNPEVEGWEFQEMSKINDGQFEFEAKNLRSFQYKYCSEADWEHVEVNADRSNVDNRTWNSTDVVALFKNPDWTGVWFWYQQDEEGMEWAQVELLPTEEENILAIDINLPVAANYNFLFNEGEDYWKLPSDAGEFTRESSEGEWWLLHKDGENLDDGLLIADKVGQYTVKLNKESHYFMIFFPSETTLIDHIVGNAASLKVIENGTLYIYRNGVKYDAQGKAVR